MSLFWPESRSSPPGGERLGLALRRVRHRGRSRDRGQLHRLDRVRCRLVDRGDGWVRRGLAVHGKPSARANGRATGTAAHRNELLRAVAYITADSIRTVVGGTHPETSWVGIGLAAFTAVTMPLLALAKRRVGNKLHSAAAVKEASQTTVCAYLSVALLIGLLANAIAGWWWADPAAALVVAAVALREGRESWRGEVCCEF